MKRPISELLKALRRLLWRNPESPEDPYAYVGAPRKPAPPHLRASAVAERPE